MPRYLLREIIPADISSIFEGLSDPRVYATCGVNYHSLEATAEQMN